MNQLQNRVTRFLSRLAPTSGLCLGFSGGLDSTVLLDLLAHTDKHDGLRAVHINHGLQAVAEKWEEHCQTLCAHYQVSLQVHRVDARSASGESPEAAARTARYGIFQKILTQGECLLTAHHQNDQVETLLLQLLRGSGPAGLAAMPDITEFAQGYLARPLLDSSRVEIHEYAVRHKLQWVDDQSNNDFAYDRNYLRHNVMPILLKRWPGTHKTLARAAQIQAQATELMQQMGHEDLAKVLCLENPESLSVALLNTLSPARLRNLLRFWIGQHQLATPTAAQLEQIVLIVSERCEGSPVVSWPGGCVGHYQEALYAFPNQLPASEKSWPWNPSEGLKIPQMGIAFEPDHLTEVGLSLEQANLPLTIRFRQGGEQIRLPGRAHRHKLKKLLQEYQIPPWLRDRLPLLFHGQELIAVFGLEPVITAEGWQKKN